MVNLLPLSPSRLCRAMISSLLLSIMTSLGILANAPLSTLSVTESTTTPATTKAFRWSFIGQPAHAQSSPQATSISNTEIRSYALSVLDIENIRQQWSDDVASLLDVDTLPSIACNDPESIRGMPRNVREMVVQFCDASIDIVEGHNLSISRFNAITELMNSNDELRERIQDELLNLQSNATR